MRYTAASCVDVLQGEQEGILWMGNWTAHDIVKVLEIYFLHFTTKAHLMQDSFNLQ
jgi:hypothetical protein